MLVTSRPSASTANIVQLFTDRASTRTTQAPHWLVSQPTCVPVRPSRSRKSSTSSVRASTSAVTGLPFSLSEIVGMVPSDSRDLLAANG